VGRSYEAIGIEIAASASVRVRVIDDERQPTLWALESFEILDGQLPATWHLDIAKDRSIVIGPKAWLRTGFWWDYFDDSVDARTEYVRELARMGVVERAE
jgi:hypothetical protein